MALFRKGRMEMFLKGYNYEPGETIEGTINLVMKKPTLARGLTVRLVGEETATQSLEAVQEKMGDLQPLEREFRSARRWTRRLLDGLDELVGKVDLDEIPLPKTISVESLEDVKAGIEDMKAAWQDFNDVGRQAMVDLEELRGKLKDVRSKLEHERGRYYDDEGKRKARRLRTERTIYDRTIPLAGEQEYTSGDREFEIEIPETVLDRYSEDEFEYEGDSLSRVLDDLSTPRHTTELTWYVAANLDVPRALDISSKQQISVE